jgi:DNA polymerase-3 subunit alpha
VAIAADDSEDAAAETVAARPDAGSSPTNGNGNGTAHGNGRIAEDISIGGIISGLRPLKTRKGDRMCVFTLDDAAGSIEVVVFPETFKQSGHYAENGRSVLVHGRFERDDESVRILATEIVPIEMVRERLATSVAIRLSMPPHGRATFERLLELLAQHKGDRKVAFVIFEQDRHLRVTADVSGLRVRPSERLVSEVEKICGSGSVSLR